MARQEALAAAAEATGKGKEKKMPTTKAEALLLAAEQQENGSQVRIAAVQIHTHWHVWPTAVDMTVHSARDFVQPMGLLLKAGPTQLPSTCTPARPLLTLLHLQIDANADMQEPPSPEAAAANRCAAGMGLPTPAAGRSQAPAAQDASNGAAAAALAAAAGASPGDSGLTGGAGADGSGGDQEDGANSQPGVPQPDADGADSSSAFGVHNTRKRRAAGELVSAFACTTNSKVAVNCSADHKNTTTDRCWLP